MVFIVYVCHYDLHDVTLNHKAKSSYASKTYLRVLVNPPGEFNGRNRLLKQIHLISKKILF